MTIAVGNYDIPFFSESRAMTFLLFVFRCGGEACLMDGLLCFLPLFGALRAILPGLKSESVSSSTGSIQTHVEPEITVRGLPRGTGAE